MDKNIKVDCKACNGEKTMVASRVSKMSQIVVLVGWILTIPAILGVIFSGIMFFSSISAGSVVTASATSEAEQAGAMIGAGLGMGFSIFMGFCSFMGGLLGYILIMKKNVFKCLNCGSIMDRA